MCRYGFYKYKNTYGCFNCQVGFKRRLMSDAMTEEEMNLTKIDGQFSSKDFHCPNCRMLMVDLGRDLRLPNKDQDEQWQCIKYLVDNNYNIYSCGCQGIGFVPHKMDDAIELIKNVPLKNKQYSYEQALKEKKEALAKKRKKNAAALRTKLLLREVKKKKMNNFLTELLQPNSAILNAKIFKNDFLKIPATMSYNIEINLVEFEIENQKINTSIYLDFIRLNIYNLQELENSIFEFPINPKAGFIDGSIYLFDVHNPVDVSKIEFFSIKNNTLAATIYFSIDFEYENTNYCKVNNCELKLILQFGELSIDTDIINAENFDEKEVYELISKTSDLNNYEKYQIKESEVTFKINRYPSN